MKIANVQIDCVTRKQALERLANKQIIFTPNPEILLEARVNKTFRRALKKASLMLPDGHGLLFVSALLRFESKFWRLVFFFPALFLFLFWKKPFKKEIPEIIHGSDFTDDVVAWAERNGKKVFFLGAKDCVSRGTAVFFQKKYPDLKVAGFSSEDPNYRAFELVRDSGAEVLFVAYGAPKQEIWIAKYAAKIPHLHVAMGVGGSFDFWSGNVRRAPVWMRKLGVEWFWRLLQNPVQRIVRIWNATIVFPVTCLFFY